MELTLENKAKFFAQYWGQNILGRNDGSYLSISFLNPIQDRFLLLTPLSDITDDDAIEVAKIILEEPFTRYRNIGVIRNFAVTGFPYIMISHKNLRHRLQIDCTLANFNVLELEDDITSQIDMKPYHCIDYLRSKGYSLPWMGLSVESMIEAGWIKLINQ